MLYSGLRLQRRRPAHHATLGLARTVYDYDTLGSLMGVTLPAGARIDTLIGPAGERLGKKLNGVLQKGWLYGAGGSPVAELDAAGQITTRFIYATHANVPDYLIKYSGGTATTYRVLTDMQGSVRLVVNVSTGFVAQRLDYDECGRVTSDTRSFSPAVLPEP